MVGLGLRGCVRGEGLNTPFLYLSWVTQPKATMSFVSQSNEQRQERGEGRGEGPRAGKGAPQPLHSRED